MNTKNEFLWSAALSDAFESVKQALTSPPTLSFFDPARSTRLCTDASRQGLGFVLQQRSGEVWVLVQAGSRFLSDAESRYAIIELEMLAISWAVSKCRLFLAGLPHFKVVTDHHPLIPILNTHRLDEVENPRLQRLKTRVMGYNFTAQWIKGALNSTPDALSRHPVSDPLPLDLHTERDPGNEPEVTIADIRAMSCSQESLRLHELRRHAEEDCCLQQLRHYILAGFPEHRSQLPEVCRPFWNIRNQLTLDDDLLVYGCRLLIPAAMRREVLRHLHESHQGLVRTKERARLIVYWPGLDNDIDNIISSCKQCQDHLPSNPREPIAFKPTPGRPFQELAIEFCAYAGHDFLVLVDCYTDWPDVIHMGHSTTTHHLLAVLKQAFCRSGVPDVIWSDQGPQFMSKTFRDFSAEWGFRHVTSTPTYPQSNGKAEATVKSMKKIIRATWSGTHLDVGKLARALLQYRNTPSRKDGLSPAQKLYGHPIQDTLPAHHRAFAPEWQHSITEAEDRGRSHLEQVELYYNRHARALPDINVGSNVVVQNHTTKRWDIYGVVVEIGPNRRYSVRTNGGRVLIRNRQFLRRRVPVLPPAHLPGTTCSDMSPPPVRRSTRPHAQPRCLIEEITF